MKIEKDDNEN